jgi:PAS domain-containing protein
LARPQILTIPSTDAAFRRQVEHIAGVEPHQAPEELQTRLRRLFPRALVRSRDISGEPSAWYVYRDGGWRQDLAGFWWQETGLPRVVASREGWLVEANPTALSLLGIERDELGARHFTDFVAPGGLDDSIALFDIVDGGNELNATVLLRPTSGDVLSVDIHAAREADSLVAMFRLADDVNLPEVPSVARPSSVVCLPESDAAFRNYVERAVAQMPEPRPEGLAIRIRRLYPHARIEVDDLHGTWVVRREQAAEASSDAWWTDPALARVRYDAQALLLEANEAARALLGHSLVGHHWQEFVTPGSTEEVAAMLTILAEVGSAVSRFRMPRADGSLLEFDSWTEVDGDSFTTVMRPAR